MKIIEILSKAMEFGASEVILPSWGPPAVRIGGFVRPIFEDLSELTPATVEEVAGSLLDDQGRAELENTGASSFATGIEGAGRFRVSIYRQRGALTVIFRRIFPELPGLDAFDLPDQAVSAMIEAKKGLILLGGLRNSGRSTTLGCLVATIAAVRECHVLTLERPVEFIHGFYRSLVDQRDIGRDIPSLAEGLNQAMLLSPDVVVVDDPGSVECVDRLVTLAENGFLVIATVYGSSVVEYLERAASMLGSEPGARARLGRTIVCATCQRLVPNPEGAEMEIQWEMVPGIEPARPLLQEGKFDLIESAVLGKGGRAGSVMAEGFMLFGGSSRPSATAGQQGMQGHYSIQKLEKMLYDQNQAVRQEAETVLKQLAQAGDGEAGLILEQFAQFYITNFEDQKKGIVKARKTGPDIVRRN